MKFIVSADAKLQKMVIKVNNIFNLAYFPLFEIKFAIFFPIN